MRRRHANVVLGFGLWVGCAGGADENESGRELTSASGGTTGFESTTSAGSVDPSTDGTGTDEGEADTDCIPVTWYADADGDGRGDPDVSMVACTAPPGYVGPADDCDDTNPDVHPFADEICDGLDNDCNGIVDEHGAENPSCNGCTTASENGNFIWFCPEEATWQGAGQRCTEMFAADLVAIENGETNAFLVQAARAGPASWFIGLNDIEVEGTFVWPDGSPATYTNWNEGEPNDAGGLEDCVELASASGVWNDIPCDMLRTYICGASPR